MKKKNAKSSATSPELSLSVQYGTPSNELTRWRIRRWVQRAIAGAHDEQALDCARAILTLAILNEKQALSYNESYRGKAYATNVLTFEYGCDLDGTLSADIHDTAFTPTTYNGDYTVWLKNRMLYQFQNRLNIIENSLHKLDGLALELAHQFMENKKIVRKHFVDFDWTKMKSERIRIHGDYHLGQILVNGDDFYILDFAFLFSLLLTN